MRMLMAKNQRDFILSHVKTNMLEWGSGGSTLYFLQNLKKGQHLTSVEHHKEWYQQVRNNATQYKNHTYHLIEGNVVGGNATPMEETPAGLGKYVSFMPKEVDTILVDGVARSTCILMSYIKKPEVTVFVHDVHRDWYDFAMKLYKNVQIIDPTPGDYPSKLAKLWN